MLIVLLLLLLAGGAAQADQPPAPVETVSGTSPGVSPPKVLKKIEPEYSTQARRARVPGTCILSVVIDTQGMPTDINVLSPLGFGLDDEAIHTVSAWRFSPATKYGTPVNFEATVQVNFRLLGLYFDSKAERQRTEFNEILSALKKQPGEKPTDQQHQKLIEMAKHSFAPAEYIVGMWQLFGTNMPLDVSAGMALVTEAAKMDYPPALFSLGKMKLGGGLLPKSPADGLDLIKQASVLGDENARYFLARAYANGNEVERDPARAHRYFHLCAQGGLPECQLQIGKEMLQSGADNPLEAVAWLELASGHGLAEARGMADVQIAKFSPDQVQKIDRIKARLEVPKQ